MDPLGCSARDTRPYSEGKYSTHLQIGGVSVRLTSENDRAVALIPSLAPFQADVGPFDIDIQIERCSRLASYPGKQLFDSGSVWQLFQSDGGYRFDFNAPAFGSHPYKRLWIDSCFSAATLQISGEAFEEFRSVAPLDYPLDELLIMHRLTQQKGIELHACGIVSPDGTANLFVGHSGAGKSTTTRLWTSWEQVEVLSDDRIIVRSDAVPGSIRIYGTPWHGEAMYASPRSANLKRIFILEHGQGNVITRLSPSQAVAELFARSFVPFHRHEYVDSALEFLQELAGAVPVYRYAFEPDRGAVETVIHFHD